jgi:hypothetical protein
LYNFEYQGDIDIFRNFRNFRNLGFGGNTFDVPYFILHLITWHTPILSSFPYVTEISFSFRFRLPVVPHYILSDMIPRPAKKRFLLSLFTAVFSVLLSNNSLYAEERLINKGISIPGEPCRVAPLSNWTKQEKWVWKRICERGTADFNTAKEYGGNLKPDKPEDWPLSRQLRADFLETILAHDPYRSAVPRQGIQIEGAWFKEPVNLFGVQTERLLALNKCRFDMDVSLSLFRSSSSLFFLGSAFKGALNMIGMQLAGYLSAEGAKFRSVSLMDAMSRELDISDTSFEEMLDMSSFQARYVLINRAKLNTVKMANAQMESLLITSSVFEGPVSMQLLRVENYLVINSSNFEDVINLAAANIGGLFGIANSSFKRQLKMQLMQVKGHASLGDPTIKPNSFKEIDMSNARIGGQLFIERAMFDGPLILKSIQIGETLSLRKATARANQIDLSYANISGNAEIAGGTFAKLDLTGTTIRGELRFESGPQWEENSSMILRNASVGVIQDNKDGWPDKLELNGFVYKQLGSAVDGSLDSMAEREESWLIEWLERQKSYSPQPYGQLSNILTQLGREDRARAVLYSGKERSRAQALTQARWGEWLWLSLQNILIGYGQKIYYAVLWALLFVGIGALIFKGSKESEEHRMPYGIAYSFDMLLPIIKLRQKHYDIDLSGWRRYYFFLHKMMGYILASFLIAGLAGMVK